MLLTTFELLVKKIAPPSVTNPFNRLVVQGYFLTVSNLDLTKDIAFYLKFTIPSDDLTYPIEIAVDRELVQQNKNVTPANHIIAYDINGINNFSQLSGGGLANQPFKRYYSTKIILKKGQTVSVQLLPNISYPLIFTAPKPDYDLFTRGKMEIRGFVEIFQAYPSVNEPLQYILPAINVLVSAEIRGTFFPDQSLPLADQDYDQINYSLPIADGKSRITLDGISKEIEPIVENIILTKE